MIDSSDSISAHPDSLEQFVEQLNETIETAATEAAQRAFNLGCFTGLVPAALILLVMTIATGFSIIGIALLVVITVIGMIAFANLAAAIAQLNTQRRVFREIVEPKIAAYLANSGQQRQEFERAARTQLTPNSVLLLFLSRSGDSKDNPPFR